MNKVYQTHYKDIQPLFQKASTKKELPTDVQTHSLMWSMISNSPKYSLDTMNLYDQPEGIMDEVRYAQQIVKQLGQGDQTIIPYSLQSLNNIPAPV